LIDTGLDEETVAAIGATLAATPGVVGLHELRTRRMAHQALVDAHVQVDARISVSEGHRIAESARQRVLRQHPEVLDVLVHIDPENDAVVPVAAHGLPGREQLLAEIEPLLADLPPVERVVLHYLGGQVEIELFVVAADLASALSLEATGARIAAALCAQPAIRNISVNVRFALN